MNLDTALASGELSIFSTDEGHLSWRLLSGPLTVYGLNSPRTISN